MSRADAKREQIVDRLVDFLLAEGLGSASLRPLAEAAGTSDRMLLYYFRDKEAIIATALERGATRLVRELDAALDRERKSPDELERALLALVTGEAFWPFMCLWFEIAVVAARGNPVYRAIGSGIVHGFHQWIANRLAIDDAADRDRAAMRLVAIIDGTLLLRGIGMPGVPPTPR